MVSERRATALSHPAPDPNSSTDLVTEVPEVVQEEEAVPPPVLSSSSLSLDEVVAGLSNPLDDFRAHQELLKRVNANLAREAGELKESAHSLIDILAAAALSRLALPVNEAVLGPIRALGTPLSLCPPPQKGWRSSTVYRPVGLSTCTHIPPTSPWWCQLQMSGTDGAVKCYPQK